MKKTSFVSREVKEGKRKGNDQRAKIQRRTTSNEQRVHIDRNDRGLGGDCHFGGAVAPESV